MVKLSYKKWLLIVFAVVVIVVLFAVLRPWRHASQEMVQLRNVEQHLSLPTAAGRHEEDVGAHVDGKGAQHYSRYILLYYTSESDMQKTVQKLPGLDWIEISNSTYENTKSYKFVNKTFRTCLSLHIDPSSMDRLPHNIFISAQSDDTCRYDFDS